MQGCALCIFEQEKRQRSLGQAGLSKLLQVLDFLRIMMQVLQQYEQLCWHVYNSKDLFSTLIEIKKRHILCVVRLNSDFVFSPHLFSFFTHLQDLPLPDDQEL